METPNLVGRSVAESDLPFVINVWNDPRVAPTVGGQQEVSYLRDRVLAWLRHWDLHGFGETVFADRRTALQMGWGGLQYATIGVGECLTVGYVIAPHAWGQGFAREIASASVSHAFDVLGAAQVFASVLSTNAASRRVLEKVGFTVHSEFDHGDFTEVVYVVVR